MACCFSTGDFSLSRLTGTRVPVSAREAGKYLHRHENRLLKFLRGAQGSVRFTQKFARYENRVGLPGVDDVFGSCGRCDYADCATGNTSGRAKARKQTTLK
jgi:hypothetical protein